MTATFIQGHVLDVLKGSPDGMFQCAVTSPPYYGLRKYAGDQDIVWGGDSSCRHVFDDVVVREPNASGGLGYKQDTVRGSHHTDYGNRVRVSGQCTICGAWRGGLGAEPTTELYIQHLVEVFREVRRVLRADGVFWLNIGDSYGCDGGTQVLQTIDASHGLAGTRLRTPTVRSLDKCLIPQRLAIALQEDGWYLRQDNIWAKSNCMPSSVNGWRWEQRNGSSGLRIGSWRPTTSHEYVFMLTKTDNYFCDKYAVTEPLSPATLPRTLRAVSVSHKNVNGAPGQTPHSLAAPRSNGDGYSSIDPSGRNLWSVWSFPTEPYSGGHFACFPSRLPEICVKASTSEKGHCPVCGKPWVRVISKGEPLSEWKKQCGADSSGSYNGQSQKDYSDAGAQDASATKARILAGMVERKTVAWRPSCSCQPTQSPVPALVLDPFGGAGTTALVCAKLGRDSVSIDISAEYIELAKNRLDIVQSNGLGLLTRPSG